jgi:hypothetical protein
MNAARLIALLAGSSINATGQASAIRWDPINNGSGTISFSNANRTESFSGGTVQNTFPAIGIYGQSTDLWYAELVVSSFNSGMGVGFGNSTIASAANLGGSSGSIGYAANGNVTFNGSTVAATGVTYTLNDVIGLATNRNTGQYYFSKNGVWISSADPGGSGGFSGPSGSVVIAASGTSGAGLTIPTNYSYGPDGYRPW